MRTLKALLALIVIATMLLTSCGGGTETPTDEVPGEPKIITIAWTQEPGTMNRSYSSMWYQSTLSQLYSCSPWQYDEKNEPYPYMLTEMPTITEDGLEVTMHLRDDLVWSDGVPVSQADYELKFKIDCDRESGATTFITCDLIQKNEYFDNGYTSTFLPGSQSPIYFTTFDAAKLPDIYPAHRVIESEGPFQGQTLADVPAKDWTTLPEVAENPIGVGPYVITEWVKGEKLVFDANPYYYGGAPKTPHVVISIITSENAEAQLIGGQVDILDLTTLVSVSEALDRAATEGIVKNFVIPSASWEHIDMNLFLP